MKASVSTFFKDKSGRVVLWQTPNKFIWLWAACSVLRRVLPAGGLGLQQTVEYFGFGSIVVWALLEVTQGATYFRRFLGALVLVASIHARLR